MKRMKKAYMSPKIDILVMASQPLLLSSVPYSDEFEIADPDEVE